jgi:hypothetical protein
MILMYDKSFVDLSLACEVTVLCFACWILVYLSGHFSRQKGFRFGKRGRTFHHEQTKRRRMQLTDSLSRRNGGQSNI